MKTDKEIILSMKDGEERLFNMVQDGGAMVTFGAGIYGLYEVPLFGGEPRLIRYYREGQIDEMIAEYKSWT